MRRAIALLLIFTLCLSLTGCNKEEIDYSRLPSPENLKKRLNKRSDLLEIGFYWEYSHENQVGYSADFKKQIGSIALSCSVVDDVTVSISVGSVHGDQMDEYESEALMQYLREIIELVQPDADFDEIIENLNVGEDYAEHDEYVIYEAGDMVHQYQNEPGNRNIYFVIKPRSIDR